MAPTAEGEWSSAFDHCCGCCIDARAAAMEAMSSAGVVSPLACALGCMAAGVGAGLSPVTVVRPTKRPPAEDARTVDRTTRGDEQGLGEVRRRNDDAGTGSGLEEAAKKRKAEAPVSQSPPVRKEGTTQPEGISKRKRNYKLKNRIYHTFSTVKFTPPLVRRRYQPSRVPSPSQESSSFLIEGAWRPPQAERRNQEAARARSRPIGRERGLARCRSTTSTSRRRASTR